jgi:hypothetical protein
MRFTSTLDFKTAGRQIELAARRAAEGIADGVLAESQKLVPDDPETGGGDLQMTGKVTAQHTLTQAAAAISYGTDHAVYQHESLGYEHPNGGSAKYLERPLSGARKAAKVRLAAEIKRALS